MMNEFVKLLSPLLFLKIKGPGLSSLKWKWPLLISILSILILTSISSGINIFGTNGFIKSINSLLAILMGFFIAALAAIASFPESSLNKKIAGKKPTTLTVVRAGKKKTETLTRRKFLCLLFGYEAFCTLFIYIIGEFAYLFAGNIKMSIAAEHQAYLVNAFLFVYLFMLSNLMIIMLLGLHHLSERMHRE